ncbi:MAG: hypothetical protein RL748_2264, partial [Pseudomonadota bacterium]
DGFSATRAIRTQLQLTLPVLAMTAGVMVSEQARCHECGMNDFIAKPIDVDQMFSVISRHLPPVRELQARITRAAAQAALSPAAGADSAAEAASAANSASAAEAASARQAGFAHLADVPQQQRPDLPLNRVFDPAQMMSLAKVNPAHRATLLGLIRKVSEESMGKFHQAQQSWQQGQASDAARLLHTMRGSIGSMGAQEFAAAALALEKAIHDQQAGDTGQIEQLFEQTRLALEVMLQQARDWLQQQ